MIRLRQSLEAGLRHPLLGPLLLLLLGAMLVFVALHTIEHGVEGLLFTCAIVVAAAVRLAVVTGAAWRVRLEGRSACDRAPPTRRRAMAVPCHAPPTALLAVPLRR